MATRLRRRSIKHFPIQLSFAVRNDQGHGTVTTHIRGRSGHIENAIDTGDQRDTFEGQPRRG